MATENDHVTENTTAATTAAEETSVADAKGKGKATATAEEAPADVTMDEDDDDEDDDEDEVSSHFHRVHVHGCHARLLTDCLLGCRRWYVCCPRIATPPFDCAFVCPNSHDLAEEDDDNGNPEEAISLENVVGRRTRGKVIDFAKAAEENPADEDEDEDEDEDFEEEDDKMDED
jgi:hypothetical protein